MEKTKNTLIAFLDILEVKHTQSYSERYFNEHPHKNNLFGLSKMLFDYGVENTATQIPDKENDIAEIQTPFIAQFGGDFAVVDKAGPDQVAFLWKGNHHSLPLAKFVESWTGVVLLAESSEKSIEPDYKEHRKSERLDMLKIILFFFAFGLIALFAYIHQSLYANIGLSILLSVNLAGMYIGWLLLLKQMHVQSPYADKICSLFKQKDCNNVLESEGAKLFGTIGLSEIGFGYFSVNVLLFLFSPTSITAIALLNIFTLPFTFWSVWYQQAKAKQWCVLCLIVLALLWSIFIINLLFGYIQFSTVIANFSTVIARNEAIYSPFLITTCCYCIMILGINIIVPKFNTEKTIQSLKQSINSIKANEDIFKTLLKKQSFYGTSDCNSIIRFGNPDSKLKLTVLSNPYCNPCSKMHKKIEELLKQTNNDISVQYILSSFKEELSTTNKYLIAACLADKTGSAVQVFADWFEKGKELKDNYFKEMGLDMEKPEIEIEFQKHETWRDKTKIQATPTMLVNGYKLPEIFNVEDLRYFTNLDL